jgi:hypothetical protein
MSITDPAISKALRFIDGLKQDNSAGSYYEVAEVEHSEHEVFPQTQYVLYITFNLLNLRDQASAIAKAHDFTAPDLVDLTRHGRPANDTYCVLEGDIKPYRLMNQKDSEYNDEMALSAIHWLERKQPLIGNVFYRRNADTFWKKLQGRYNASIGFLEMDPAEKSRKPAPLHAVYKLSLFGILARRMMGHDMLSNVRANLRQWQDASGGWITDRTLDLAPDGVANLETTCLSILALADFEWQTFRSNQRSTGERDGQRVSGANILRRGSRRRNLA